MRVRCSPAARTATATRKHEHVSTTTKITITTALARSKTHLVEFVAEVNWVDIVAFKIGEHDDLDPISCCLGQNKYFSRILVERTKKTIVKSRPAAIITANKNSHPTCITKT